MRSDAEERLEVAKAWADGAGAAHESDRGCPMSETITKACPDPYCAWCKFAGKPLPADCQHCHGAGRVPDVEATLRAEVARLTEELATQREHSRRAARKRQLQGAATKRARARARSQTAAKVARLTAEVERLKGREKEVESMTTDDDGYCVVCGALSVVCEMYPENCIRAAWLAGCKP